MIEFILIVLLLVVIATLFSFKRNADERFDHLDREFEKLKDHIKSTNVATPPSEKTTMVEAPAAVIKQTAPHTTIPVKQQEINKEAEPAIEQVIIPVVPKQSVFFEQPVIKSRPVFEEEIKYTPSPIEEHHPSFFERNPDLEKFIGENLVSKIGIAILVLAIGFFVKYAIDNDWIRPVGRVGIGILCGGVLAGLAHYLRNNYKAFSSVLLGGGLAVFYFTITLAYHQFELFSQTAAFIIMVVITGFAVTMSLLYNRQELAIIALVGGFSSPFLVSNGSSNYIALFTYLAILNVGLLVVAYHKAWRLLNLLAFIFTVIIYSGWLLFLTTGEGTKAYRNGLLFGTLFYLLFFAINIAHNVKENKKFIASDFGILLANTCLYFATGLYCLTMIYGDTYRGLFCAVMGAFNLSASYFLFRNRKVDANILYLLIGLTLTFISLTAPIQLHGHYITLFWASETVLLFWLFQKSRLAIVQIASLIVWIAMLMSLVIDWSVIYNDATITIPIIINKGFITSMYVALATFLLTMLMKKETKKAIVQSETALRIAGLIILFTGGALEINYQFRHYFNDMDVFVLFLFLYTYAFILVFSIINKRIASKEICVQAGDILLLASVVLYLFAIPQACTIQSSMLQSHLYEAYFIAHWISTLLVGIILYRLANTIRSKNESLISSVNAISWIACIIVVIYLSIEISLLSNAVFYTREMPIQRIRQVYIKTGLPVLWGLCSFGFMWLGMKHKYKTLRIISLSLFCVTLIKLFFFDISNIPIAGKIAAFFCLGVILLVVSFMYQRLKKIIIEDEKPPAE